MPVRPSTLRILVLDTRKNAATLGQMLENMGLRAALFHSQDDAVAAFLESDFDLVILDGDFKTNEGLRFLQHLRGQRKGAIIPVIILGRALAQSEIRSTSEAQAMGADEFFKRPIRRNRLRSRLSALTGVAIPEAPPEPATVIALKPEINTKHPSDDNQSASISTPLFDGKIVSVDFKNREEKTPLRISKAALLDEIIALAPKDTQVPPGPSGGPAGASKPTKAKNKASKPATKKKAKKTTKKKIQRGRSTTGKPTKPGATTSKAAKPATKKKDKETTTKKIKAKVRKTRSKKTKAKKIERPGSPPSEEIESPFKDGQTDAILKAPEPQSLPPASEFITDKFFDEVEDEAPLLGFDSSIGAVSEPSTTPDAEPGEEPDSQTDVEDSAPGTMMDMIAKELASREDDLAPVEQLSPSPKAPVLEAKSKPEPASQGNIDTASEEARPTRKLQRIKTAYGLMAEMLADGPAPVSGERQAQAPVDALLPTNPSEIAYIPSRRRAATPEGPSKATTQEPPQPRPLASSPSESWENSKVADVTASVIAAAESSAKEAVQEAFDDLFQRFPQILSSPGQEGDPSESKSPSPPNEAGRAPASSRIDLRPEQDAQHFEPPDRFETVLPVPILDSQRPESAVLSQGEILHLFDALILLEEFRTQTPSGVLELEGGDKIQLSHGSVLCSVGGPHCARLMLRLLDDGVLSAEHHQELVRSGFSDRPDQLINTLAESGQIPPTQVWDELDGLLDEAITRVLVFRGAWTFRSTGRSMQSGLSRVDSGVDIRPRLSGLVYSVVSETYLMSELSEGRTRIVIVRWPQQLTQPQDRAFLRALNGRNSFNEACEFAGVEPGRSAALAIVLLALGHAKSLGETQSGRPPPSFEVESWENRQAAMQGADGPEPSPELGPASIEVDDIDEELAIYEPENGALEPESPMTKPGPASIEERYAHMKHSSYYEILGVQPGDDLKSITLAYHQKVDQLSEELGALKPESLPMAEKLAQGLTEAHQVLIHPRLAVRYGGKP